MEIGNQPRLSIGLPVHNGERFLKFALDSLLEQTFTDFEIIISDNASTDDTRRICQEYAARDSRIRYSRNLENIGAAANFNRVFELARGTYFKWAAADDIISPNYLEKCVQVLDCDPSIILCYSKVDRINSSGEIDGVYDYPMRTDDPLPHVRFSDLILINHFCVAIFGVARREVLAQTPLIEKYVGSDRVLLAELGLRGKLFEIPDYLFHRRDHPQTSGRLYTIYKRLAWFDPARSHNLNLVNWTVGWKYYSAIRRVRISWSEKIRCYQAVGRWFINRRFALIEDIKAAIIQVVPFSRTIYQYAKRLNNKRINTGGGL